MTAMTVTVTAASGRFALAVKVLTGAAASQPGATATSVTATSAAITPTGTGSIIYGAYQDSNSVYPATANAATSIISDADGFGHEAVNFRATATTTSGTPVTVGLTPHGGEASIALALCEILAAGTLTEDASSPAPTPVGSSNMAFGTSLTSASFTPPAGALLVVMASDDSSTLTITDTSGLGLTWTQQVLAAETGGSFSMWAGIWTAQIPGGGSSTGAAAALATATAAARNIAAGVGAAAALATATAAARNISSLTGAIPATVTTTITETTNTTTTVTETTTTTATVTGGG